MIYEKIKEQIKVDFFQQNFPNDGQRFVAWYLRNIHLRDMNETKDDITDGADDKLKRKLSEVSQALDDDYEVSFELVTTSKLTESAQKDLETFQIELAKLSENKDWNATISLVDKNELERRYELSLEKDSPYIN
jgi:hypothetical protein